MNTYRYSEDQRRQWVKDKFSREKTVKEICREASISRATLYNWIEEFKHLAAESNRRRNPSAAPAVKSSKPELLQKSTTDAAEKYRMLVAAITSLDSDKSFSKKLVAMLIKRFTLTVSQACAIAGLDEAAYGYKPRKPEVEDYIVYEALVELIREDRTREFETCYTMLVASHPDWTRKQIKRVYRDGMVYLERKRSNVRWERAGAGSEGSAANALSSETSSGQFIDTANKAWNIVMLEYQSELNGKMEPWWMIGIVDDESKRPANAMLQFGKPNVEEVIRFLDRAATENGVPRKMKIPGKSVFTAREITRWAWQHKMAVHTFSLNKPENAVAIEEAEQQVFQQLGADGIGTKGELHKAVNNWTSNVAELA